MTEQLQGVMKTIGISVATRDAASAAAGRDGEPFGGVREVEDDLLQKFIVIGEVLRLEPLMKESLMFDGLCCLHS